MAWLLIKPLIKLILLPDIWKFSGLLSIEVWIYTYRASTSSLGLLSNRIESGTWIWSICGRFQYAWPYGGSGSGGPSGGGSGGSGSSLVESPPVSSPFESPHSAPHLNLYLDCAALSVSCGLLYVHLSLSPDLWRLNVDESCVPVYWIPFGPAYTDHSLWDVVSENMYSFTWVISPIDTHCIFREFVWLYFGVYHSHSMVAGISDFTQMDLTYFHIIVELAFKFWIVS